MSCIEITGGRQLYGQINIQGSKNAALPILAAALLHKGVTRLEGCPRISDVSDMLSLLECMGCLVVWEDDLLSIDGTNISSCSLLCSQAKKTRSSVLLLGALLGRIRCAEISYPGGCSIGVRPIDFHLDALRKMKVQVQPMNMETEEGGNERYLSCSTAGICGSEINLPFPSVGATENIILAAVLAEGTTVIQNAAREPEITTLANFLNAAGARILGAGEPCITIQGVISLYDTTYRIPEDRIVAGTYLAAVAAAGGEAELTGIDGTELLDVIEVLRSMNCKIYQEGRRLFIQRKGILKTINELKTKPYPGFPTDLQSQFMVLMSLADGKSQITETIFEDRFLIADTLINMGADIVINDNVAIVQGVSLLHGVNARVTDLRGGAALVLAGLAAKGNTVLEDITYVERGYEDICRDLSALGGILECK